MSWNDINKVPAPISRPVLVRTTETNDPVVAFLGADGVWYEGGALVQNSATVLGGTPSEWCEPAGDDAL